MITIDKKEYYSYIGPKIVHGDYHFGHKKISLYSFKDRKKIIEKIFKKMGKEESFIKNLTEEKLDEYLFSISKEELDEYLLIMNSILIDELKGIILKELKEREVKEYINLGDFIFNFSEKRLEKYIKNGLIKEIENFMIFLKSKGLKTIFIYGNHDNTKSKFYDFYKVLFDEVVFYKIEEKEKELIVYTHFPLHYDFNKNSIFKENDTILLKEVEKYLKKGYKIINIHGHTHDVESKEKAIYKDILYINNSIEMFLKEKNKE